MLPTKFRFIWTSTFRREDFLKSANQKQELPIAAMFVNRSGQKNRNLVGSIYGRFSLKSAFFVPIRYQTWPPQTILVSDWLISKNSSPLKPLNQIKANLAGMVLGWSLFNIVSDSTALRAVGTKSNNT
jgi:hypothetical protein